MNSCTKNYVVNYSRPAVVAYSEGVFYTTPLLRFDSRNIDIEKSEYLKKRLPVWVDINLPEDPEEKLKLKMNRLYKGLETSIDFYLSYESALSKLPNEGYSIQETVDYGIEVPEKYLDASKYRVYKLITRYDSHAVILDTETGEFEKHLTEIKEFADGLVPVSRQEKGENAGTLFPI